MKGDELDRVTRAQIRNLEERSALWVAKHLVMAGRLLDIDPELAFQHALAASRRGGRLAAVREAVGLTAYGAGHYGEALREFRTFRRISGSNVHLPVMADCERGLGRPDRALDLARSEEAESLDAAGKAELAMVVSGARSDLGQLDAAVAALEIPQLDLHRAFSFTPRLFRAYAEALDAAGRASESEKWRRQARVAEKALGLDDDLEPDIIDLGEDDEPAPSAVPKVAEVLGAPTAAPAPADEPVSDLSAVEDRADSEQLPVGPSDDAATVTDEDEDRHEGPGEPEDASKQAEESADAPPTVGVQTVVALTDDATEEPAVVDEPSTEDAGTAEGEPALEGVPAGKDAGPAQDELTAAGPAPVDSIPAGESAASPQPLQAEMLFSMDGPGAADLAPSAAQAAETAGTVEIVETAAGTEATEGAKAPRGTKSAKDGKNTKSAGDAKVTGGAKGPKEAKATKGAKSSKEAKGAKAPKEAKAPKAPKEAKATKASKADGSMTAAASSVEFSAASGRTPSETLSEAPSGDALDD